MVRIWTRSSRDDVRTDNGPDARRDDLRGDTLYNPASLLSRSLLIDRFPIMAKHPEFHHVNNTDGGIFRELAAGLSTRIYPGEHAMLSVVTIAPNARGELHHHPEEQWGLLLEGSATRFQGDVAIAVSSGDFWRTPPNVPHTMQAGPGGAKVLDIFAPPRAAYKSAGTGFAGADS
jgi:quercetin dioxygenase-like cupin family protein